MPDRRACGVTPGLMVSGVRWSGRRARARDGATSHARGCNSRAARAAQALHVLAGEGADEDDEEEDGDTAEAATDDDADADDDRAAAGDVLSVAQWLEARLGAATFARRAARGRGLRQHDGRAAREPLGPRRARARAALGVGRWRPRLPRLASDMCCFYTLTSSDAMLPVGSR